MNVLFTYSGLLAAKLVKLAKRLKKEKVNVDIINFGEEVSIGAEMKQHKWKLLSSEYLTILLSPTFIKGGEYREADCLYKYS